MKNYIKTGIIFLLLFSAIQINAQGVFNIRYKYEKGKTYFYRTITKAEGIATGGVQEMTSTFEQRIKTRMKIASFSSDKFEIILSLDSMYTKSSNSLSNEDNISNNESFLGKKVKLGYNISGKKISSAPVDNSEEGKKNLPKNSIIFQISDKQLKTGDIWNVTASDTSKYVDDGNMINTSETEYKVEGKVIKNGVEYLKISFIKNGKSEGSGTFQGETQISKSTSKLTGIICFDILKGIIFSIDISNTIDNTVNIPERDVTNIMKHSFKTSIVFSGN